MANIAEINQGRFLILVFLRNYESTIGKNLVCVDVRDATVVPSIRYSFLKGTICDFGISQTGAQGRAVMKLGVAPKGNGINVFFLEFGSKLPA